VFVLIHKTPFNVNVSPKGVF